MSTFRSHLISTRTALVVAKAEMAALGAAGERLNRLEPRALDGAVESLDSLRRWTDNALEVLNDELARAEANKQETAA